MTSREAASSQLPAASNTTPISELEAGSRKLEAAAAGRFRRALAGEATTIPPIWLMRQAGRYHSHYQRLRAVHSFETLCRTPELAAQVALGPIQDFDLDAAILFSDLLFPLDALGLAVSYDAGRPVVDGPLTVERLQSFHPMDEALARLSFQREAVAATRAQLAPSKGLIGFIGGPWTLFVYAVEGTHAGDLSRSRDALPLYNGFASRMVPLLIEQARQQLAAGADLVMMFDTAAGALPPDVYGGDVARDVRAIASAHPGRVGYFARDLSDAHEKAAGFDTIPLAGRGFDMHRDLVGALSVPAGAGVGRSHRTGFIHGNMNPAHMLLTGRAFDEALERFLGPIRELDAETRRRWMCGLGHGVLPATPEDNVRRFVTVVRETFA